jgi:hypothetical protein
MSTLMQANAQWSSRPDDERFTSLYDMKEHFQIIREQSRGVIVPSRKITVVPQDNFALAVTGPNGHAYNPTHWAFGQLAARAGAPAGYLRTLPAPIAADALNYGIQFKRDVEDVGVLIQQNGTATLRAVTGPNYGRIWNEEIVRHLVSRFGDGVTGQWKVPGEFGKAITVTKANTTLYAGDRDMFVFLCDEQNRIEIPNRRNGESGSLARGFFVWNSEVGSATFGISTFLFDYVCCNRMIWGATEYKEIRMRHTVSAPDKFMDEARPALEAYANSSARTITDAIANARQARLDGSDGALDAFLTKRFGARLSPMLQAVHLEEEGRPIETLWDAATAVTAYARGIGWQDERVALERKGGELLSLASA